MEQIKYQYFYQGTIVEVGRIDFLENGTYIINDELIGGKLRMCTGLVDDNGKEIYSRDAVRVSWLAELGITEIDCEAVGVVKWDKNTCGFYVELIKPFGRNMGNGMSYEETSQPLLMQDDEYGELNIHYEIIGDIDRNPEFLNS